MYVKAFDSCSRLKDLVGLQEAAGGRELLYSSGYGKSVQKLCGGKWKSYSCSQRSLHVWMPIAYRNRFWKETRLQYLQLNVLKVRPLCCVPILGRALEECH